jgi:hypothetical protein
MRHAVKDVTGKHYIKPSLERNREALELVEKEFLKLKPRLKLKTSLIRRRNPKTVIDTQ